MFIASRIRFRGIVKTMSILELAFVGREVWLLHQKRRFKAGTRHLETEVWTRRKHHVNGLLCLFVELKTPRNSHTAVGCIQFCHNCYCNYVWFLMTWMIDDITSTYLHLQYSAIYTKHCVRITLLKDIFPVKQLSTYTVKFVFSVYHNSETCCINVCSSAH